MSRFEKRELGEVGFLILLLLYVISLLLTMPSGNSRLFPLLVTPFIGGLIIYQIINRSLGGALNEFIRARSPRVDRRMDMGSIEHDHDESGGPVTRLEVGKTIGWITAGVILVYVLGLPVGGGAFIFGYLMRASDFGLPKSAATTVVVTMPILAISFLFEIDLWGGILH